MQVDHLDSKPACKHQGCHCSVPSGEEFCSEHCRNAEARGSANEGRGSCGCGHPECNNSAPAPQR
jgi:hypothetical protein